MDKGEALRISKGYLQRVKDSDIGLLEAWLFGSYVKGNQHDNSDIDIALVIKERGAHSFETEVQLMLIRKGEELAIEPHAFTTDEFDGKEPIVYQIINYGERIEI
ncbi:MAG: nucleotidyltransferase domain-containing protein [Bacteroidetes bacterium]|nr:nucleotidyltransferase domain-containing protein [Bacteroidota bacterium]